MASIKRITWVALALCLGTEAKAGAERQAMSVDAADVKILNANKVGTSGSDLMAFFRMRTLNEADRKHIAALVIQLDSPRYMARKNAEERIIKYGPPCLPLLKKALKNPQEEVKSRAANCIKVIAVNPGPALPLAALRTLEAHQSREICPTLLGYLPFSDNVVVEESVKEALLSHARYNGKIDADLLAALKDKLPLRRSAAAYALGGLGDVALRPAVRALLADPDATVRKWAAFGLVGKEIYRSAEESRAADAKLFAAHKLPVDDAELLAFFRKRTLSEADESRLRQFAKDLGDASYRKRERACRELSRGLPGFAALARTPGRRRCGGPHARPQLHRQDRDWAGESPGTGRRPANPLPVAQSRAAVLARLPSLADDDEVEESVLQALCVLAALDVQVGPALIEALKNVSPSRRAAAAYVLGRVGSRNDCKPVHELLSDRAPKVRFHAAAALVADRDKAAIPALIELLSEAPLKLAQTGEGLLESATGAHPNTKEMTDNKASRKAARDAWAAWWQLNGAKLDLSAAAVRDTVVSRMQKARLICTKALDAYLHLNVAGFKRTLKYPIYMEGMDPRGNNVMGDRQIDDFFRTMSAQPQIKELLGRMAFKIAHIGRLGEYLEYASIPERTFLSRLSKSDTYVVFVAMTMNGVQQPGGEAAMFVRLIGGRAWVVGLGNSSRNNGRKR